MDKYMDRFLKCVPAEDVVVNWVVHNIISPNTRAKVERALPDAQCGILFKYIRTHGSLATIRKMCDLMIETGEGGYPNMRALGEEMKEDLEQYSTRRTYINQLSGELNLYQEAKPRGMYVPFMCELDVLSV